MLARLLRKIATREVAISGAVGWRFMEYSENGQAWLPTEVEMANLSDAIEHMLKNLIKENNGMIERTRGELA